jgi:CheY-like chemotaxis protein
LPTTPPHGIRVLLADDNKINQLVAKEILQRFGVEVITVDNGREAVAAVMRGDKFDMVFMDIQMPEMDGLEATTAMRQLKGELELPIIAMTAYAFSEERQQCLSAGMNDHIAKPIDPDQLYSVVLRWIHPGKVVESSPQQMSAVDDASSLVFPDILPGIDVTAVIKRCGGNRDLARDIIVNFRDQNRSTGTDIRSALESGDREQAQSLIHSIRGLSGTIGALSLLTTISELETAVNAGNEGLYTSLLATMDRQLAEVLESAACLEHCNVDHGPDGTAIQLPMTELAPLLKDLHNSLQNNSLDAKKLFEQVKNTIRLAEREEICKYIDKLDFKKAATALERTAQFSGIDLKEREHGQAKGENSDHV